MAHGRRHSCRQHRLCAGRHGRRTCCWRTGQPAVEIAGRTTREASTTIRSWSRCVPLAHRARRRSRSSTESAGEEVLGVGAKLPTLGWTVIVEQPTREAFAISTSLQRLLFVSIAVALFAMLARRLALGPALHPADPPAHPRHARTCRGTDSTRGWPSKPSDEMGQLGTAFNTMADRLVELQEDVRKKERHAMFGRIAIGLVHDLSHPIQNVGNGCKLSAVSPSWRSPRSSGRCSSPPRPRIRPKRPTPARSRRRRCRNQPPRRPARHRRRRCRRPKPGRW